MNLSSLKIDASAIEQGRWIKDLPELGDIQIKTRGTGNADWRRLHQKLVSALPAQARVRGLISPEEQDRIGVELLVETALLDWKNITDDDGVQIPFSKEKAREFLENPDMAKFKSGVQFAAGIVGEEEEAGRDADEKN